MDAYITWFEIAAFIACLLAVGKLWNHPPWRVFPFLLGITVCVEALETFVYADKASNAHTYNVLATLQLLLYGLFLYLNSHSSKVRRIMLWGWLVFLVVALVSMPFYWQPPRFNVIAYTLGCILLVNGILLAFYEMLKSPQGFNFLKLPIFYVLFALLLFIVGTLPYFAMGNWLYFHLRRVDLVQVLANVMSILNYLLYTTYAVCFLWIRATKVTY